MTGTQADRAGLLAAVHADPTDDLPRLAFADWLEEFGETAADRALLRLARSGPRSVTYQLRGKGPVPVWDNDRLHDLLEEAGYACRDLPPPSDRLSAVTYTFRLGFLDRIDCPLAWWMAHGKQMVSRHPLTAVGATNAKPVEWRARDGQEPLWSWHDGLFGESLHLHSCRLPDPLFRLLLEETWPTRQTALAGLSAAMLVWAREGK